MSGMHSFAKEESTKRAAANGGAKMRLAPEGARSDVPITFLKRQQGHAPGHASYAVHAVDPSSVPFEEERNTIKLGYAVRDTRNLPPGQQQDLYATDTESIGDSMIGSSINGFTRGQRGFTADTRPAVEIGTDNGEPDDGESGSDDEPGSGEEEEEEEEDDGVEVVAIPTIYSESHAQQDYHTPGEPGSHIPISRAAQEQRLDNPVSQGADYQDGNGVVIQEEENPYKELDYDPQELFEKTYESLTAENFDFDPLPMAKLPEGLADASLEDKLSSMAGQDAPAQAQFFNTLDIHQWEEAGDWFLDRFSDVLTRLKTARREKRGLARAFENEVEQRHEAVSRKRKATESALEDMKKNGGMVLQRTPKKQKQKYKQ
ncbi:hypothetical protein M8818_002897 [Zalaria obscura]|uniref:Uncharacterized protein n=1 Tax=Zalaria obscura TaxID=2024903 RepID=A0ACC3SHT3_9PEZI